MQVCLTIFILSPTNLFLNLYLAKFLSTSAKLFFPHGNLVKYGFENTDLKIILLDHQNNDVGRSN